jgi:hypothetical protein
LSAAPLFDRNQRALRAAERRNHVCRNSNAERFRNFLL